MSAMGSIKSRKAKRMKAALPGWKDEKYYRIASAALQADKLLVRFEDGTSVELDPQRVLPSVTAASWRDMSFNNYEIIVPTAVERHEISGSSLRALTDREYGIHLATVAEEQARYIGRRIKELREERGISSKELAGRAGISPQSLSRIEHGRHDVVFTTLRRILAAMGSSLKDLVVPEDEDPAARAAANRRPNTKKGASSSRVRGSEPEANKPDMEKRRPSFEMLADEPISKPDHDRLGRTIFAQALAKALISRTRDPMVIALQGTWGSGKTSLLNMTVASLEEQAGSSQTTVIFPFNPWNFASQADLVRMFFSELAKTLDTPDVSKRISWAHDLATKLDDYAEALSPLIALAPIPGAVVQGVRAGIKAAKKASETPQPTIPQLRAEIDRQLGDWDGRLVILLDDIDRLTAPEIRQVFQLVKLTADFPNTTYLLAFDPCVVTEALRHETAWPSEDYLEKIVQVPLQVPAIEPERIRSFLLDGISRLVGHQDRLWDERYFWSVYLGGFEELFHTIRDVKRFLSSVGMSVGLMGEDLSIVDLLGVEALRIRAPQVYVALRANRSLLLDTRLDRNQQAHQQHEFTELVSLAPPEDLPAVAKLLKQVFPGLVRIDTNSDVSAQLPSWQRQGRIAAPENFDAFFLMSPRASDVQQREVEAFIRALPTPDKADEMLRDFYRRGLLNGFLNRLTDRANEIPEPGREVALRLILIAISNLDVDFSAPFSPEGTAALRAVNFCQQILREYGTREDREKLLDRVLASVPLDSALKTISYVAPDENALPINELLDESSIERLRAPLMKRIEQLSKDRRLILEKRLLVVLGHWFSGDPDAAREWARKSTTTDEALVALLRATVATGYVDGKPFSYIPSLVTRKLLAWEDIEGRLDNIVEHDESLRHVRTMAALGENIAFPRYRESEGGDAGAAES